ncbi:hypothetical protein GOBAR_AA33231 [Gossypium barbadense]|uniref:Uncharacterized protein n=1 Tax=Gossypium barbadense TaxID=3634 RepID=A0A2P5W8M4_GOSBA|nr:hypothetical protein GOBAR_AA33231 [Gossypium barbadense]
MDTTLFQDFPSSMYAFKFDHGAVPVYSNHDFVNNNNGFIKDSPPQVVPSPDSPVESWTTTNSEAHPLDNIPFANEMLKYINEMLMEEDMEEKTCMLQDCLALQAAEKSFYEVLGHEYPLSTDPIPAYTDQNGGSPGDFDSSLIQTSLVDSLERTSLFPDLQRGIPPSIEPSGSSLLGSKGRKNYERGDVDDLEQGRSNKQSAVSLEDSEQTDMFDDILLCKGENEDDPTSAADILKAYRVLVLACPFKKMMHFYANKKIMKVAEKATTLHIVDFGICYGFQWPCLIQRLSARAGGPPKLRITGIEFPQPGFRPAERVEETGRRLKRYCEKFKVPFEYNVIAKKWETIQLEELKIKKDEVVIVNCMYRLKNLPDDTLSSTSARDIVLKLIRSINPEFFIHGISNGTYNAPFFVTRFREALFHFSAMFDIFEANVPRDDPQRMMFEREVIGRDIMNVVACEGIERVERPETYKQWQARTLRAGFKQIPLDQYLVKKVTNMVQSNYHRDFIIDVDGRWMLQGWKGRVIFALSCWKPVKN